MKQGRSTAMMVLALVTTNACSGSGSVPPGTDDPGGDSSAYVEYRQEVRALVEAMTLDQKLGQMTLPKLTFLLGDDGRLDYDLIQTYSLGAVLGAGGEVPDGEGGVVAGMDDAEAYLTATLENWREITAAVNAHAPSVTVEGQSLSIPLLLGIDAVHGMHAVLGNVVYPHNIGLSMTHDPALLDTLGRLVADDMLLAGFNWTYAPTVAVSHNPNWGRTFETLGSVPQDVYAYAHAYVSGLQQTTDGRFAESGVLATVKHFVGDGATYDGIDQGSDLVLDEDRFLDVNSRGYGGALAAGVGSLMTSYSAINDIPMTIEVPIKQALFEGSLVGQPFTGFVVSDYGAVDNIAERGLPTSPLILPYPDALARAINSGVDMIMLSNTAYYGTIENYLEILEGVVESGAVSIARIDEAVTNILAVKCAMGLLRKEPDGTWNGQARPRDAAAYSREEKIASATEAAEKSLVLLKNDGALLPLDPEAIEYVVLLGNDTVDQTFDSGDRAEIFYANYDNVGVQVGGWTVAWQGTEGNVLWQGANKSSSGAMSLGEALERSFPEAHVLRPTYANPGDADRVAADQTAFLASIEDGYDDMDAANTVLIGVLAERPYAEFMGDVSNPYCEEGADAAGGCLYSQDLNPYLPTTQPTTLAIDYDDFSKQLVAAVRAKDAARRVPLVSVLYSGRPRIIDSPSTALETSDAFIAAWLPGTAAGPAVSNAIHGGYSFCGGASRSDGRCPEGSPNTLSVNWVRNDEQLEGYPVYVEGEGFLAYDDPRFPIGYGLPTSGRR